MKGTKREKELHHLSVVLEEKEKNLCHGTTLSVYSNGLFIVVIIFHLS